MDTRDKAVIVTRGGAGIGFGGGPDVRKGGSQGLVTGRRQAVLDEVTAGEPNMEALVAGAGMPADAQRTVAPSNGEGMADACPVQKRTLPT
jgi:uncharacterized oxidoreductase